MNKATTTIGSASRRVLAVMLAVGLMVVVDAHSALAGATDAPTEVSEQVLDLDATCEVSRRRTAQVVACSVRGLAPEGAAALSVVPAGEAASPQPFIGGTSVAEDGTATLEAEVPCDVSGPAHVEVTGPTSDGGRFRHVEPVTLEGCRPAWELIFDEWATVLATVLVVGAAVLVAVLLRRHRRQRRRRRRRSVTGGAAESPSRARRDAGR